MLGPSSSRKAFRVPGVGLMALGLGSVVEGFLVHCEGTWERPDLVKGSLWGLKSSS